MRYYTLLGSCTEIGWRGISFLAFMSRKRLADKLGQIRLDWAVSQNEVQTTDKAKISALGYLSARWPWNKKSKMRFKGSRSSYLRFLGFVWGFGCVLNRRGLKRQNLGFRVMRNLHKILGGGFGWNFGVRGEKILKKFSISRGCYYDTPPRVSRVTVQKFVS